MSEHDETIREIQAALDKARGTPAGTIAFNIADDHFTEMAPHWCDFLIGRVVGLEEERCAAIARVRELEALIAEAPHSSTCDHWSSLWLAERPRNPCDCFKSRMGKTP